MRPHPLRLLAPTQALARIGARLEAFRPWAGASPGPGSLKSLVPAQLVRLYDGLRRDLKGVLGQNTAPLAWGRSDTAALQTLPLPGFREELAYQGRPFAVRKLEYATASALTVYLESLSEPDIDFLPGQYLTLVVPLEGQRLRRAYSICSVPWQRPIAITIKRTPGGLVSNYLHQSLREGQILLALGPSGQFTVQPAFSHARHLVLFAGGSGVTPLFSIAQSVLEASPNSLVSLLDANDSLSDIIFHSQLEALRERYPGRFVLQHILRHPPQSWSGDTGCIEEGHVIGFLKALPAATSVPTDYYVCGPLPMMELVSRVLLQQGQAKERIHQEHFTSPGLQRLQAAFELGPQPVRVFRGQKVVGQCVVPAGGTVLEAALSKGLALRYSCTVGGCGACRVRLRRGSVHMSQPNALSQEEASQGYILACIAHPTEALELELEP